MKTIVDTMRIANPERTSRFVGLLVVLYGTLTAGVALLEQGLPQARPFSTAIRELGTAAAIWLGLTFCILALVRRAESRSWSWRRRLPVYAALVFGTSWIVNALYVSVFWIVGALPWGETTGRFYALSVFNFPANAAWTVALLAGFQWWFASRRRGGSAAQTAKTSPVLTVCLGRRRRRVPAAEIQWIEADGDYVKLHTTAGSHVYNGRLYELERQLADHGFLRVHRCALINRRAVSETASGRRGLEVVLRSGRRIPVSRRRRPQVRRILEMREPTQVRTDR